VIGDAVGVRALGDAAERVLAEAHDPSEKQLGAGNCRGLCEGGCQGFDKGRKGHGQRVLFGSFDSLGLAPSAR
jgi:hypothetical protein